ncbi:DUF421 domain-containing protein [Lysobacter korlensis]|uniref:DUF421 domain-containing protein n=1 Tax=Lysobacter korlensis TaxID=553636 RepID=A0ABV6RHF3_9GAMM
MDSSMFFENWSALGRTLIIGVLAYSIVVVFLRISGKRTLSKWNAFDFIVTIALGSTLASIIISKDVALAQGALALGVLIALQFVITWLAVRVPWLRRLIKSEPALLLDRGRILHDALKRERVSESELRAAVRANGNVSMEDVEAVVLETDGTFSVIKSGGDGSRSALEGVAGAGPARAEQAER